jgi:4-hydroxy-tetrahydrodipicolinate reductase
LSGNLNLVVLGRGKTGAVVGEVATVRGHQVRVISSAENLNAAWLTSESLKPYDVVIDFTTPQAVHANIGACLRAHANMVVGTTGWNASLEQVRQSVEKAHTGFVFGANFSYGVNLFFQIVRSAAPALAHGYAGHITERHHVHKKDAPSGTAVTLQDILEQAAGVHLAISSEREGDVTGTHTLELTSSGDRLVLTHEALSRRTFAEGAVLAAEWIAGKRGFYDFKDIFSQL